MNTRSRILCSLLGLALSLACSGGPTTGDPAPPDPAPAEPRSPAPALDPDDLVVDRLDQPWLAEAEDAGYGLYGVLARGRADPPALGADARLDRAWTDDPAYRALAEAWTDSLTRTIDGVVDRDLVVEHADAARYPAGNVGRAFDVRWLQSPYAFFQLVGVVNRLDRRDFAAAPSCGEVRLIYRLAYQKDDGEVRQGSRLPFTVNVVLTNPGADCGAVARRWTTEGLDQPGAWLQRVLEGTSLQQVEVDVQAVRFPAGFETEFGGQAIYLLQVFGFDGERVRALPLENTPDVARLSTDEALRSELVGWIEDHLPAIDQGVYRLPDRFLATTALSYSTLGINRRANKPFGTLFQGDEGRAALPEPPSGGRFVASRRSLVERLDDGTCSGCHQAGSTAGFHLLGQDDPAVDGAANQMQIGFSPHFLSEQTRRRSYLAAVANGAEPDRFRPHSLSLADAAAGYVAPANHPCVPAESAPELAAGVPWGCEAPFACEVVARDETAALPFGQCVLPPERAAELRSGMTCRAGEIRARRAAPGLSPFNQHAYKDRFEIGPLYDLPEDKTFSETALNCRPALLGVPLGRTYRTCTEAERALQAVVGPPVAPEMCAVVGGTKFDACAQGNFHACLEGIVGRGMIDTCHLGRLCREDYSCQRLPAELPGMPPEAARVVEAGVGFCTPTYFLFQLRLDGHPVPVPQEPAAPPE